MNHLFSRFRNTLAEQRWDDHRYYHQSRVNQSLHFVSAASFLVAYAMLFIQPAWAGLIGWLVSMSTRQSGHFFFEPRGYDHVNQATDEHKEAIKVGYNIHRKKVLIAVWAGVPLVLWLSPSLFGLIEPGIGAEGLWKDVGIAWLLLGVFGMCARMVQLWWRDSVFTAVVWGTKILTDPLHDLKLYWRAPIALLNGELLDPMYEVRRRLREEQDEMAAGSGNMVSDYRLAELAQYDGGALSRAVMGDDPQVMRGR